MKRILFAAVYSAVFVLGACASSRDYAPKSSPRSAGYSDQMLERDRYRISYTGTRDMGSAEVQDYALMRAAQLTLEQGGQWFEVVTSDTDADTKNRFNIDSQYDHGVAVQRSCGLLGCTSRAVPVITRTDRETVEQRTVYEHSMEILVGRGAKSDSTHAYNARETFANLQARLG